MFQCCDSAFDDQTVIPRRRRHRADDVIEISGDEDCEIVEKDGESGPSDFDASGGEASEDEDAVIERRRRERQAKLAKLSTAAPPQAATAAAPRFEKVSAGSYAADAYHDDRRDSEEDDEDVAPYDDGFYANPIDEAKLERELEARRQAVIQVSNLDLHDDGVNSVQCLGLVN